MPGFSRADVQSQKLWSGRRDPGKPHQHVGADIHDPKVRTSVIDPGGSEKLRSGKLRAEFSIPKLPVFVYFQLSRRSQTEKKSICARRGVSADSRKSAQRCAKARFWAVFLEMTETPLSLQINILCVLSPALNLSKTFCVFPCLDKAIGKRYQKSQGMAQKILIGD